jgi:hypothetical protein
MRTKRYQGRTCHKHPELRGERWRSSRRCTGCARDAHHSAAYRQGERARRLKPERREALREYRLSSDVAKDNRNAAKERRCARIKERRKQGPTYIGGLCARHPEEKGNRQVCGTCIACHRESCRKSQRSERHRARRRTPEYRAKRMSSEVDYWNRKATAHSRRARKQGAIPADNLDAINREFKRLKREARKIGMTIDHIVPLAPCRVCGARGLHIQSNWAMLPNELNASKGNRCMSCWMSELGRPVVVWMPKSMPSAKRERELRH